MSAWEAPADTLEPKKKKKRRKKKTKDEVEEEAPEVIYTRDEEGCYDINDLVLPLGELDLPRDYASLHYSFGIDVSKRYNLHYLNASTLLYATGNCAVVLDVNTLSQKYIHGVDIGGAGSTAVHPSQKHFAVAEKGTFPNLLVFEFPSLKLKHILRKGTERAYSDVCFSQSGKALASVGSYPDFMLTVWDWEREQVILRAKAFSQDIYKIAFSPANDGVLISSGTGHIRFWQMANTFTGLKLQGHLGKFGKLELSDVCAFVEMPNGKVISGTEQGYLLLWDGIMIEFQILKEGGVPCHSGPIEALFFENGHIISGGSDGWIRHWNWDDIHNADNSNSTVLELKAVKETHMGAGVRILNMIRGADHWVVEDSCGAIWRLNEDDSKSKLLEFPSGGICALDTSPNEHIAATTGMDGSVRLYDYVTKVPLPSAEYGGGGGTALRWAPLNVDPSGRSVCTGFMDGTMRVVKRCSDGLGLSHASKPHTARVTDLQYSPDGKLLVTGSEDSTIFFFNVTQNYLPVGFVALPSAVLACSWNKDSGSLLVSLSDGSILVVPRPPTSFDTSVSFELGSVMNERIRSYEFTPPPPPEPTEYSDEEEGEGEGEGEEEEEEEFPEMILTEDGEIVRVEREKVEEAVEVDVKNEEELPPCAAPIVLFTAQDTFLVSFEDRLAGTFYECTLDSPDPVRHFPGHAAATSFARISTSGALLLSGARDGSVKLRTWTTGLEGQESPCFTDYLHDGTSGTVTGVCTSFDDAFLVSTGADGNLFVQKLQHGKEVRKTLSTVESVDVLADASAGLLPEAQYSIQEEKLRKEEDKRMLSAEEKKAVMLAELERIRDDFTFLLRENAKLPVVEQVSREDFCIEPELYTMVEAENQKKAEVAKKVLEWDVAKNEHRLAKLRARFLDDILTDRFVVRTLEDNVCASSFRTASLSSALKSFLEEERGRLAELHALEDAHKSDSGGEAEEEEEFEEALDRSRAKSGGKSKVEQRKQRRALRDRQWAALNARKPRSDWKDPRDVEARRVAEETMGDFKLKTADNYIVPPEQRVDAKKKLLQMMFLEEEMCDIRQDYNKELLRARAQKARVVDIINEDNERIREIRKLLGMSASEADGLATYVINRKEEYPEERGREIEDEEFLKAYQKEQQAAAKKEARKMKHGMNVTYDHDDYSEEDEEEEELQPHPPAITRQGSRRAPGGFRRSDVVVEPSAMELEEKEARDIQLNFEMEQLLHKHSKLVGEVDQDIRRLRRVKLHLSARLIIAEMRLMMYYKELVLLKEFEKQDDAYEKELADLVAEKQKLENKVAMFAQKIQEKMDEEMELPREEEFTLRLQETIVDYLDKPEIADKLATMFGKTDFRRGREQRNSNAGSSDWEDYSEDSMEGDQADECPPGCAVEVYEAVLALRGERAEVLDQLEQIDLARNKIDTECTVVDKKISGTMKSIDAVADQIEAFQKHKQDRLNELTVVTMLECGQILYLNDDGSLPVENRLVFTRDRLRKLHQRTGELDQENEALARDLQRLEGQLHKSAKDQKAKQANIADLKQRALDVQMLKFGKQVDLDQLLSMSVNKPADELKARLVEEDAGRAQEIKLWQAEIKEAKAELGRQIQANSRRLQRLADLTDRQGSLERGLDTQQRSLVVGEFSNVQDKKQRDELANFKKLAAMQEAEMRELRHEIHVLTHKGGLIFPPIHS